MNFKNLASDWLLPAAGAYLGYGYGGATGAGLGAAAGRFGGGLLKDEETSNNIKNSMFAGAAGYGGATAYDNYGGGGGAYFGSMGGGPASGAGNGAAAAGGGGMFSGGMKMPMAMMGLNAIAQMYGAGEAQKNAGDIYSKQLANWNSTAFPNAARVDAQTASAMSGINQQSMIARQRLMDSMAARGMGANSGVLAGAAAEEDRARRARMAALANNLIQFRNTPMYGPPQLQYTQSAGEKVADTVGSSTGLMAGMGLYNMMR